MNHAEAIAFLQGLQVFGARFGLDTMRTLARRAGHPERRLRFIHVAGTNGKGSTCAMLDSIARAAGLRVGLYTSPHLVSLTERIQVNRTPIPDAELARCVSALAPHLQSPPLDNPPTFFEAVTLVALQWFAGQQCDLVVWETGLGGRLDATNIVTPLASVITQIGWDHQQWLGDTLDQIAAEKAGIIKPGVPVITAATPGAGLEVITETARRLGAPLTVVDEADADALPGGPGRLGLAGPHQRRNAAAAVAAWRAVAPALAGAPGEEPIARGLAGVQWPGRLQVVRPAPGRVVVLDGAHNPDGAAALRTAFAGLFPGTRPAVVLGVLADKQWEEMIRLLGPMAGRVVVVPVQSQRTVAPETLRDAVAAACPGLPVVAAPSASAALDLLRSEPLVLVAGSLYLIGEALEALGAPPAAAGAGRALNEWSSPGKLD
ncbi:MAG: hypothetical protein RJA22_2351 [Verrucomicrobiota bacterium]|jgi:dihydrofolate synthase/folylpolyglutamate synthase